MSTLLRDLRGGLRGLLRSPASAAIAILTIALGIGLNTTMFTIVEAVLLRPLPFRAPGSLVAIRADFPGLSLTNVGFSLPEIEDLSAHTDIFEQVAAVCVFDANLTGGQRPERVVMSASGPEYFQILGARAQLGRVLGTEDRADGFAEAVVLSDGAWQRLFGGDPSAVGRQIRIDTDLYTIVGVMPLGFRHPAAAPAPNVDVWSVAGFRANPFASPPVRSRRNLPSAIARLHPQVSIEDARAAIAAMSATVQRDHAADYPADSRWIVKSGRFVTAGAALSHMDLALYLVRGVSPRLASLTAKYLIVDSRPSQSAYALTDHLVHSDPLVLRFETWARATLRHGFSLAAAAKPVGFSKRTLARRMQSALGQSPGAYFQRMRIERAVHLLKTSSATVDEVATRVGYTEGATLRTVLRRRLNIGIKEIRRPSPQVS